jgi:hypothetical protein
MKPTDVTVLHVDQTSDSVWPGGQQAFFAPDDKWLPNWSKPEPVLSNGNPVLPYAVFAGWVSDDSQGWHTFRMAFSTQVEAEAYARLIWSENSWWQVVHLLTQQIVSQSISGLVCCDSTCKE